MLNMTNVTHTVVWCAQSTDHETSWWWASQHLDPSSICNCKHFVRWRMIGLLCVAWIGIYKNLCLQSILYNIIYVDNKYWNVSRNAYLHRCTMLRSHHENDCVRRSVARWQDVSVKSSSTESSDCEPSSAVIFSSAVCDSCSLFSSSVHSNATGLA